MEKYNLYIIWIFRFFRAKLTYIFELVSDLKLLSKK